MKILHKITGIVLLVMFTGAHLSQAYNFTIKNCTSKWILANLHGLTDLCGSVEFKLDPGSSATHEIPGKLSGMSGAGCCADSVHVYHSWNPKTKKFGWDKNLGIDTTGGYGTEKCASHTIYIGEGTNVKGQATIYAGIQTRGSNPSC